MNGEVNGVPSSRGTLLACFCSARHSQCVANSRFNFASARDQCVFAVQRAFSLTSDLAACAPPIWPPFDLRRF
jgi:hypothetical protein